MMLAFCSIFVVTLSCSISPSLSFRRQLLLQRSTHPCTVSSSYNRIYSIYPDTARGRGGVFDIPQLLQFYEPVTNVSVVLVGAMHYNPASIQLTTNVIDTLVQKNVLSSVVIESCETRWNRTMLLQNSESSPFIKQVLKNEMMAASNIATSFNRPVILGDQCINVTNQRIALAFKDTIRDILNPFNGWSRLYADVSQAVTSSLPTGPNYLGASDFFDSKLLFNAPVSLLRYPLAFLIKAPLTGTVTLSTLLLASYLSSMDGASTSSGIDWSDFVSIVSVVPSELLMTTLIFAFELALLSRVFIVTILAERNNVLAESIVRECFKAVENGEGKSTVVAVLGMAHCNGIKKIITERKGG